MSNLIRFNTQIDVHYAKRIAESVFILCDVLPDLARKVKLGIHEEENKEKLVTALTRRYNYMQTLKGIASRQNGQGKFEVTAYYIACQHRISSMEELRY